ncbi:MAG: alpha/beta fold hydrolase [Polyangiales bacterium]
MTKPTAAGAMTAPDPMTRFQLDNGVSIAADTYGDPSNQTVLFLHGGGQTRHAWGASAKALAELGFHTIATDHRGHGDSGWSDEGGYKLEVFARDLLALLEQLDEKPIIVGASLGGIAALRAEAISQTSVAKALVLVDTTPRMETAGVTRILRWMLDGLDGFASLDEAADAIAAYLPHRPRRRDLTGLAKNLRLGDDGRYRWHWDPSMIRSWNPDDWGDAKAAQEEIQARLDAARQITIPVLLIRGRLSDVVSEATAQEFLSTVPHAEYVDLKDAAHMVAGDRNDTFTSSVAEFILEHFPPAGETSHDQ